MALMLALPLFAAGCIIDDPEPGPNLSGDWTEPEEPAGPETFITVDGDFSDWDAIPADELVTATVPDDAFYSAGRRLKVYAGDGAEEQIKAEITSSKAYALLRESTILEME